jgi:hypothetical protein
MVPQMETSVENLLLANTTQIVNSTLNNNEMVRIAGEAVKLVLAKKYNQAGSPVQEQPAEMYQ